MRKKMGWMTVFAILVTVGALAQEASVDPARAVDHDALRALRTKVTEALNKRDMNVLRTCFAKEFAFTGVDQTVVTTDAELKAYDAKMFGGEGALLSSLQVNPEATILTKFIGDNQGYCYGTSKDTYTLKDGTIVPITSHWTATVVKEDGEWKVAAGHAGVSLLENPVLTRAASYGLKLGAGGLGIGLVLGLLVGWLVGRRKTS